MKGLDGKTRKTTSVCWDKRKYLFVSERLLDWTCNSIAAFQTGRTEGELHPTKLWICEEVEIYIVTVEYWLDMKQRVGLHVTMQTADIYLSGNCLICSRYLIPLNVYFKSNSLSNSEHCCWTAIAGNVLGDCDSRHCQFGGICKPSRQGELECACSFNCHAVR